MSSPLRVWCGCRFPSGSQVKGSREANSGVVSLSPLKWNTCHSSSQHSRAKATVTVALGSQEMFPCVSANLKKMRSWHWRQQMHCRACILFSQKPFFALRLYSKVSKSQWVGKKPLGSASKDRGIETVTTKSSLPQTDLVKGKSVNPPRWKRVMEQERGHLDQREDVWLIKATWSYWAERMQQTVPSSLPLTMTCFMHCVPVKRSEHKVPFFCERETHLYLFIMTPDESSNGPTSRSWMANSPVVHLYSVLREKLFKRTEHSRELMDPRNGLFFFCIQRRLDSCITNVWKSWLGFIKTEELFRDQFLFKPESRYEKKKKRFLVFKMYQGWI